MRPPLALLGILALTAGVFYGMAVAHGKERDVASRNRGACRAPASASHHTGQECTIGGADQVQARILVFGSAKDKGVMAGNSTFIAVRQTLCHFQCQGGDHRAPDGVVTPVGNGTCEIKASVGEQSVLAKVTVQNFDVTPPVSFRNQIVPVFTKLGCNSGGCHGKQSGQNGFKLSLLGFDPEFDYNALVNEARGRRLLPSTPQHSLLLLKATGMAPHGGGKKFNRESVEYALILRWLAQGAPRGSDKDPHVSRIEVYPPSAIVARHGEMQMLVTAFYSDGTQRDVTREAQFKSNEINNATVDEQRSDAHRRRSDWRHGGHGSLHGPSRRLPRQHSHGRHAGEVVDAAAEEQLHRRTRAGEVGQAQADTECCMRRRDLPAPGFPRLHRHAADAGRGACLSRRCRSQETREGSRPPFPGPQ